MRSSESDPDVSFALRRLASEERSLERQLDELKARRTLSVSLGGMAGGLGGAVIAVAAKTGLGVLAFSAGLGLVTLGAALAGLGAILYSRAIGRKHRDMEYNDGRIDDLKDDQRRLPAPSEHKAVADGSATTKQDQPLPLKSPQR